MTIASLAASTTPQSIIQAQSTGRTGHRCHDRQGDDGSGNAAATDAAPSPGGFMMDLLQSLQNMLSAQTSAAGGSTAAANATAATDTSAVTGTGAASDTTVAGAQNVAATTAKDFATFLQALFQAVRAANAASTGTVASSDSGAATMTDATSASTSAVATAAATTAAATNATTAATATDATAAVTATSTPANPSPVGNDGGNSTHAGGHHRHHGMGAYRSNLVSGLQSVLQQLKSTDGGAGSADLSSLNSAYSTLMQDLSGAQGGSAVASSTNGSTTLQGFLTDLIGGLQSRGNTAPQTTGSIISASV
jgi:hypothetical protein